MNRGRRTGQAVLGRVRADDPVRPPKRAALTDGPGGQRRAAILARTRATRIASCSVGTSYAP